MMMRRNLNYRSESLTRDVPPHVVSTEEANTVEQAPPFALPPNTVRTRNGFNKGVHFFQHEKTKPVESRKIRVLLMITGLAAGGATKVVLDIARYLNAHPDFDVHLLTGKIPPGRTDVTHLVHELGIDTRVIPSLSNRMNPIVNVKAVSDIGRIMAEEDYDIVHTHSSVAGVVGRLAASVADVPVVIHHVHGWGLRQDMSKGVRTLYITLERLCARCTSRIITVSSPDIQKGLAHGIGDKDKFTLIYNGIDLKKFRQTYNAKQMREELGLNPQCKVVGMIGRLDKQKNPLDLIRTAAIVVESYPSVQFLIVGDGSLRPQCERLITELDLKEKFFLLGYRNDVPRIMSVLTITAMSSLWEGLPLAFLEAMSAGKPIVANDVDGARDVVINGETGFLVAPRQPSEMAERILCLLKNEKLCQEMANVARQRSNGFSEERMFERIESLYRELSPVRVDSEGLESAYSEHTVDTSTINAGIATPLIAMFKIKNKISAFKEDIINKSQSFAAPFSERRALLSIGDALMVLLAISSASWLRHQVTGTEFNLINSMKEQWYWLPLLLSSWWILALLNDLYDISSSCEKMTSAVRVAVVCAINLVLSFLVFSMIPTEPSRAFLPYVWIIVFPVITLWRWTYATLFNFAPFKHRVVIVGKGLRAESVAELLGRGAKLNYHVLGYVDDGPMSGVEGNGLPVLGEIKDLCSLVQQWRVNEIVLAIEEHVEPELFAHLVECQANGARISSISNLYEKFVHKTPIEHLHLDGAMHMISDRAIFDRLKLALKRFMDLVLAAVGVIGFIAIFPLIALAIRLDSAGPIFYRQVRIGRGGTPFSIIKFRTMAVNAEEDGQAKWATANDKRITRVGAFLRKTRLDEIPQLLNVLKGDMSIVGPRPERPQFIEQLQHEIPFYSTRLMVKPGITGWAQIRYDYGNTFDDARIKLQYDFYYLRHWSLWLDLYIVFQTIGTVLKFRGV